MKENGKEKPESYLVISVPAMEGYFFPHGRALMTEEKKEELRVLNKICAAIQDKRHYIMIGQDEPYAQRVWSLVQAGERDKLIALARKAPKKEEEE
jgi:hypothetical protein